MSGGKMYRIGEVAEMLHLKTHVLRFWEMEFPQIEPMRTDTGHRVYSEKDVGLLRRIQQLLHEQGMTIEGAKRVLSGSAIIDENEPHGIIAVQDAEFMNMVENELMEIRNLLSYDTRP